MFIKDDTVRTHFDAPQSLQEATAMGWRVTESKDAVPGMVSNYNCPVGEALIRWNFAIVAWGVRFLSLLRSFWNGWAVGSYAFDAHARCHRPRFGSSASDMVPPPSIPDGDDW